MARTTPGRDVDYVDYVDGLLADSDPALTVPVQADFVAVALARAPMRSRRRRPLLVGAGLVAAGVVGFGSAAMAGVGPLAQLVPGGPEVVAAHSGLQVSDGDQCAMEWRVVPERGVPVNDPAVVAANDYLANLDYDSIDISAKVAEVKKDMESSVNTDDPNAAPPKWTRSGLESTALSWLVFDKTRAHLFRLGLDPNRVSFTSPTTCGEPALAEPK